MAAKISGLYAVTPDLTDSSALLEKTKQALEGGARLVQYRNKSASAAVRLEQAKALLSLCRQFGVLLIVNDHLQLAIEIGADGVHLGADDGSVEWARRALGPERILGVSCYNRLEVALEAERLHADYVAFGSFFPSSVKPGAVVAPVELLGKAKERLRTPVVAIGGINLQNASIVVNAGADAVAVISALFDAPDVQAAARGFAGLFETARARAAGQGHCRCRSSTEAAASPANAH